MDLLNLNSETAKPQESNKSPSSNFDLLSGFGDDDGTNINLEGVKSSTNKKPNILTDNDMFDPFGANSNNLFGNFNTNNASVPPPNGNQQQANNLFTKMGN